MFFSMSDKVKELELLGFYLVFKFMHDWTFFWEKGISAVDIGTGELEWIWYRGLGFFVC